MISGVPLAMAIVSPLPNLEMAKYNTRFSAVVTELADLIKAFDKATCLPIGRWDKGFAGVLALVVMAMLISNIKGCAEYRHQLTEEMKPCLSWGVKLIVSGGKLVSCDG